MKIVVVSNHGKWMGEYNIVGEALKAKEHFEQVFPTATSKLEYWL